MIITPGQTTPNDGANEAFKILMDEVRAGRLKSFLICTGFSDMYAAQVPKVNDQSVHGSTAGFGEHEDLVHLLGQAIPPFVRDMGFDDRMAVGFVLMAAALGGKPPQLVRISANPSPEAQK